MGQTQGRSKPIVRIVSAEHCVMSDQINDGSIFGHRISPIPQRNRKTPCIYTICPSKTQLPAPYFCPNSCWRVAVYKSSDDNLLLYNRIHMVTKEDYSQIDLLCKGRYRLLRPLHQKCPFFIYLAQRRGNEEKVVLKCARVQKQNYTCMQNLSHKTKLDNEYEALSSLNNQNIVKFIEQILSRKWRIFVVEYCEGGTLQQRIANGTLSEGEVIEIFRQILKAFSALFALKFTYQNLSAENIFFKGNVCKLWGFGHSQKTSKLLKKIAPNNMAHQKNYLVMAPEVWKGEFHNISTDVWSAGAVIFQMLTGVSPFGKSPTQRQIQNVHSKIDQLKISEGFKQLLKRMIVMNPSERLKWAQLLRMCTNKQGIFSVRPPAIQPPRTPQRINEKLKIDLMVMKEVDREILRKLETGSFRNSSARVLRYKSYFAILVTSQIIKTSIQNDQYLKSKDICQEHKQLFPVEVREFYDLVDKAQVHRSEALMQFNRSVKSVRGLISQLFDKEIRRAVRNVREKYGEGNYTQKEHIEQIKGFVIKLLRQSLETEAEADLRCIQRFVDGKYEELMEIRIRARD